MNCKLLLSALSVLASVLCCSAATNVVVSVAGDVPWFTQSAVTYGGEPTWQSGDLSSVAFSEEQWYVESSISMTVQGPCTLTFQLGVDQSQGGYSYLECYLDDESVDLQRSWNASLVWTENSIAVREAGSHEIRVVASQSEWIADDPQTFWIGGIGCVAAPASVTVAFDGNGGACATQSREYATGGAYGDLPTPSRAVGEFDGWYTAPMGGRMVSADDFVWFDVGALYARWGLPIEEALGVGEDVQVEVSSNWRTGEPSWYGNIDHSHDGEGCACADAGEGDGGQFTVSVVGPGRLSFLARCLHGSVDVSLREEGEYYYSSRTVAGLYSYAFVGYGNAQVYSVTGCLASATSVGDGWTRFDLELYGQSTNVLDFSFYSYEYGSATPFAAVDEMSWTPADEPATVTFECASGSFMQSRTYAPGDTYGDLPVPSARAGYVFAGWCLDEALCQLVSGGDYVPFAGAHLYAKWTKALALNNEGWYEGELTYTTGESVYQSDFTPGVHKTWIEFEVPSSGFLTLWMNIVNYEQYEFCVDGQPCRQKVCYSYSASGESGWQKQYVKVSGSGKHKVRLNASVLGYWDYEEGAVYYEDGYGSVAVRDVAFEKYALQPTFGAWTDKVKSYSCWVTGNMPSLQQKYAADKTPKGRVLHALTTLVEEGESKSLQSLLKGFGYTFDYMQMERAGKLDFSSAPTGNKIVDTLTPECEALVKEALADLEAISADMSPFELTAGDCAYFDDGVTIDYGDILYMRAALKGMLGFAYWAKAYNVEIDYGKLQKLRRGVALKTVANEASLKTEGGWRDIGWLVPSSVKRSGRSPFKAVKSGSSVYVYAPSEEEPAEGDYEFVTICCVNAATDKGLSGTYYDFGEEYEEMPESKVDLVAELDGATVYRLNVKNFDGVKIADVMLEQIRVGGSLSSRYWSAHVIDAERFLLEQTKVADKIRNASALATAKGYVQEALQVWQQADAKVAARTCECVHLIEYDGHSEEATKCLNALRRNLPKALKSLGDGSVQSYEWLDLMMREKTRAKFEDTLAEPIRLNVNRLFSGDLTRSVLPPSVSDDYYVPAIYEMDPTLGGFAPSTTRSEWANFLDAAKVERSGELSCEFDYEDNGDGTVTLTGIVGALPKGTLEIPAQYDDFDVTGIGEKFLEKTSGITSVVISEGICSLGREAFHEISTLASVSLPSTLESVGEKAFCDCPKLSAITVADGNETVKVIDGVLYDFGAETAIVGLSGIAALTLPDGITRIGKQAFCACSKLATADMSASDLVSTAKNAFAGCSNLTTVRFPATFDLAEAEPFLACSKLKDVYFLGAEPDTDETFYYLEEDAPGKLAPATTHVKQGFGWDGAVASGTWRGRPIAYPDANPYLSIDFCDGSEGLGTISGGGKNFKSGSVVKLTAKANKGYVFAGWYCDSDGTRQAEGVVDYRSTGFEFVIGYADVDLYARFVPVSEDFCGEICVANEIDVPQGMVMVESESLPTVTVSGLPAGLTFDKKTCELVFDEKKMKAGDYAIVISAKNAGGYRNDRVLTFVYGEVQGLDTRYDCAVGEAIEEKATANATGLPPGVKCVKAKDGTYVISGAPTKVGRYKVKEGGGEYYFLVNGAPSRYIAACVEDLPAGCKVSGSGIYAPGGKATLKATAAKGMVFAGWYEDGELAQPAQCGTDYRNATLTITDVSNACDAYYPRFIELRDDFCGEIWVENEDGVPEGKVYVESESLPTVTVSGLPAGLTFNKTTGELVLDEAKMKAGDYAIVVSAKNAGGYKNDRVLAFAYHAEAKYESWGTEFAVGEMVSEYVDYNLSGLPAGLKCAKTVAEDGETIYYLAGVPTKPGRYAVKGVYDGGTTTFYMTVQGAPSRYVEVVAAEGTPAGCKVTGSGVYAAGATIKTSATADKNSVFANWCAEREGEEGETVLEPYINSYAEFTDKDCDPRLASQTWLLGTWVVFDETYTTLPIVPEKNYARLVAQFVGKKDDAIGEMSIYASSIGEDVGEAWNVLIEDGKHTTFGDDASRVLVTVDSVSAPKLTIKGTVAGLTIKNYGTWAELYCDPTAKTKPKPGEYTLTLTAQNQSKQTVTRTLAVRIPNELAVVNGLDVLANLDTSAEGHFAITVGESLVDVYEDDPQQLTTDYLKTDLETLSENYITITDISVSGLPSGVTCKNGYFSGTPTKAGVYLMTVKVTGTSNGSKMTATATAFFRVEAIPDSVVGTFNGGVIDEEGDEVGTVSATVSAAGKLTSCKIVDCAGKSTTVALKTQTFRDWGDYCEIVGADKDGEEYRFEFYPVTDDEESEWISLGGWMTAYRSDVQLASAPQNVWDSKTYKAQGLLPDIPSKGIAPDEWDDDLELLFKPKGAVTVKRYGKSASARLELTGYSAEEGWAGTMTVCFPGSANSGCAFCGDWDAGYCRTFAVSISNDKVPKITQLPEPEPYQYYEP